MTTGGMTRGRCTIPFTSAFPQKSRRANAMPIAKPNGRLAAMATVATRRLSLMAVHSSGLSVHHSVRIVSPLCYFRTVKPWASNSRGSLSAT